MRDEMVQKKKKKTQTSGESSIRGFEYGEGLGKIKDPIPGHLRSNLFLLFPLPALCFSSLRHPNQE
jgi:hypothetical protein